MNGEIVEHGIIFRSYPEFGDRVISPANTARYAAMVAGDEWVSVFQYENARSAYGDIECATGNPEAALSAASLYGHVKELPPKDAGCEDPKPEAAYYAACELFALASGITLDEADIQLREDFTYYSEVRVALTREWRKACEAGEQPEQAMDFALWMHLTAFLAQACGINTSVYTDQLKDSHHRTCSCGNRG